MVIKELLLIKSVVINRLLVIKRQLVIKDKFIRLLEHKFVVKQLKEQQLVELKFIHK